MPEDEAGETCPRKLRVIPRLRKMGEVNGVEFYKLTHVDKVEDADAEKEAT